MITTNYEFFGLIGFGLFFGWLLTWSYFYDFYNLKHGGKK